MASYFHSVIDFVGTQTHFLLIAVFLLALSEAIPVVGTVVPGSTSILGISALATTADLNPWVLGFVGLHIPYGWSHSPLEHSTMSPEHGIANLPAVGILLLLAGLVLASTVWGLKKSRLQEPGYRDH